MGQNSPHSVLRQLIESGANPPDPANPPAAVPTPVAVPTTSTVEPQPTSAAASPRTDSRQTVSRQAPGLAAYLKILAENAPVAMAIFDHSMRYLFANQRWLEIFRLEQTEWLNRSQYEVFPSLHPGWRHVYERALSGQVVRSDRDTVNQAGQPVLYRWEVRPWRQADATVGGVMITCLCIAGMRSRDTADGADQAPEAAASAHDGLWTLPLPLVALDASGKVLRAGALAANLFLSSGLSEGKTLFWHLFAGRSGGRELRGPTLAAIQSALKDPSALLELPLAASLEPGLAPATWHLVKAPAAAGFGPDCVLAIGMEAPATRGVAPVAVAHDPEYLARLQAAIREAEEAANVSRVRESRLRSVLGSIPCGLLLLDERGRAVFHNEPADALLGEPAREGQPVEEWLAQGCRDEQHRAEVIRRWREGVWRKQLPRVISLAAGEGLLRDIELRPAALPGGGMLVVLREVTDERRSEELLRATEAKFRTIVHENPVPLVMTDRSGLVFEANAAAEILLGRTRAELRTLTLADWFSPESLASRGTALRDLMHRGDLSTTLPVELRRADGGALSADLRLATVPDAQGQPAATVHFIQPKEKTPAGSIFLPLDDLPAETSGESPAEESIPPGKLLLSTDAHGRIVQWGEAAAQCFGLSHEEAIGRGLHTLFRPSDASGFYADLIPLNEGGGSHPVDWNYFHPERGRVRGGFVLVPQEPGTLSVALMSGNTSPVQRHRITVKIPAPPRAAGDIRLQPAPADVERERMLLGETHHRVKNHLQIITSMLNLQLSTIHHDDAREALRSSQNRVRSIAALHQHLYALAMGEAGGFAEFASGLIAHLRECYEVPENRVAVELRVPAEPVPEEWLMPLALSLNEMVSNAFKHAYAGGRRGRMTVELTMENGSGGLLVADDGAGLPADFDDHRTGGLGLKIMRVFAGQLGGDVRVTSEPGRGASFRLHFPLVPAAH